MKRKDKNTKNSNQRKNCKEQDRTRWVAKNSFKQDKWKGEWTRQRTEISVTAYCFASTFFERHYPGWGPAPPMIDPACLALVCPQLDFHFNVPSCSVFLTYFSGIFSRNKIFIYSLGTWATLNFEFLGIPLL